MDALLARHALVESELASGLSPDAYVKLSREFAELGPVIEAIKAYRDADKEIADLKSRIETLEKLVQTLVPAKATAEPQR